jgi:hypothetical protein
MPMDTGRGSVDELEHSSGGNSQVTLATQRTRADMDFSPKDRRMKPMGRLASESHPL